MSVVRQGAAKARCWDETAIERAAVKLAPDACCGIRLYEGRETGVFYKSAFVGPFATFGDLDRLDTPSPQEMGVSNQS